MQQSIDTVAFNQHMITCYLLPPYILIYTVYIGSSCCSNNYNNIDSLYPINNYTVYTCYQSIGMDQPIDAVDDDCMAPSQLIAGCVWDICNLIKCMLFQSQLYQNHIHMFNNNAVSQYIRIKLFSKLVKGMHINSLYEFAVSNDTQHRYTYKYQKQLYTVIIYDTDKSIVLQYIELLQQCFVNLQEFERTIDTIVDCTYTTTNHLFVRNRKLYRMRLCIYTINDYINSIYNTVAQKQSALAIRLINFIDLFQQFKHQHHHSIQLLIDQLDLYSPLTQLHRSK